MTLVGGEPSLMLQRVKKVYDNFWLVVVTNGIKKIPYKGFQNMTIGVSVWGDHATDKQLRGNNKVDVFVKALKNYRDDPRELVAGHMAMETAPWNWLACCSTSLLGALNYRPYRALPAGLRANGLKTPRLASCWPI